MSHGPIISVHTDELSRKDRRKIKDLMEVAEIGDQEERVYVAEYLNEMLNDSKVTSHLFGFWNHRPNQEVEDYDDLIDYFRLYARIVCKLKVCTAIITADYKDHRWLYDADKEWEIEEDSVRDNMEWFNQLKLKRKVYEGDQAKKNLDKDSDSVE